MHMDSLSDAMSGLSMAHKRSFVDAFLQDEAVECSPTKKNTRLELARAQNREETTYQNMMKTKERIKKMLEKLREIEASHNAARDNVQRLKMQLKEDE